MRWPAHCTGPHVSARRYQDLVAWQLANKLKIGVYEIIDTSTARNDFRFATQVKQAASSAPANLAEGFGAYHHGEFARYVRIAGSSLFEVHCHLGDGVDRGHWSRKIASDQQQLANRAIRACTGLLRYLARSKAPEFRGDKKDGR